MLLPVSLQAQVINDFHGFRCFRVDFNLVYIPVFPISEGWCDDQPILQLLLVSSTNLVAKIPDVVIIRQAAYTDDQIVLFAEGVDALCDGQYSDLAFTQIIYEQCRLRSVTA